MAANDNFQQDVWNCAEMDAHETKATLMAEWPGKSASDGGPEHSAIYHMLDVAAVAERLIAPMGSATALEQAFLFLIALHDIGKISDPFRNMLREAKPQKFRHWEISEAVLLWELPRIKKMIGGKQSDLKCLFSAVSGHHGGPPSANYWDFTLMRTLLSEDALAAQREAIDAIGELFPNASLEGLVPHDAKRYSWWLSGQTVVADWIGSNTDWFPARSPDLTVKQYFDLARRQALVAVKEAGLASPGPNMENTPFVWPDMRPMQRAVTDVVMPEGPVISVIEDATGSGKTEAALILAHRMMQAGKGKGLFFALPTMATANAMFGRLATQVRDMFDAPPSLALAHGRAALDQRYSALRGRRHGTEDDVTAANWLADDRRRALLADVGVGTIDQALMAVLPTRFSTLRLYGLTGKILIVDEAHDYDPYMAAQLEALLQFHATLGGSAILMTATLPKSMRQRYIAAFRDGGNHEPYVLDNTSYPALSLSGSTVTAIPVAPVPATCRSVKIQRLESADAACDRLSTAAKQGAACVWVRNAVDEAIAAVEALRARGVRADLLHARFALCDRLATEQDILARFGRSGEGRSGRVLVGTQVLEQSLDLDFDVMVSDLAPIGALIQRAGRLWRHMDVRPANTRPVPGPVLDVLAPDPDAVMGADWLSLLGQGAWVYDAATQWRTARALFDAGAINAPDGLRPLIEAVHGADMAEVPQPLLDADLKAAGKGQSERGLARQNVLDINKGYQSAGKVWDDAVYPTRLGREQITLVLAKLGTNGLEPWSDDPEPFRAWALSEVSIDRHRAEAAGLPDQSMAVIVKTTADWPNWKRKQYYVAPVGEDGVISEGLKYDRKYGLIMTPSSGMNRK